MTANVALSSLDVFAILNIKDDNKSVLCLQLVLPPSS